jgi:hypothetical protein
MKSPCQWLPLLALCVFANLGCRSPVPTDRAIKTEILSDPPGARIEIDGDYVGEAPVQYTFLQDKSGNIIGNYVIRAWLKEEGQPVQVRHLDGPYVPGTGHTDKVPQKMLFDMKFGAASSGKSQNSGSK